MRQINLVFAIIALGLVSGCGGGPTSSTTAEPSEETAGDLEAEPVSEEPGAEGGAAAASGPGRLRVVNRVGGQESTGAVRVLDSTGAVVAEGTSGDTFTVQAGTYRVAGEIADPAVLIDTPARESDGALTVLAGQDHAAQIDFPVARVRLRVTARGRPVAGWRAELRRQATEGEPIQIRAGEQHIPISPGRYEGTLHFANRQIAVNGLIFQGGATMEVPISVD